MGPWNVYFIAKLVLHCTGRIALNPWLNLGLVVVLLLPSRRPVWRTLRGPATIVAAAALLYHESFLPSWRSLSGAAGALSGFSLAYLGELLARTLDVRLLLWSLALVSTCLLMRRWLRISAFVVLALLVVPFLPLSGPAGAASPQGNAAASATRSSVPLDDGERLTAASDDAGLDQAVERFFAAEARRRVVFPQPRRNLDLIILQVCSLAWDDLQAIGLEHHPLLSRFDVLYTHFNSAASYSGPAAIRLLRGTCGQPRHAALYAPAPQECLLMEQLQQAGFHPQLLLNHDGRYGHFREDLERRGGLAAAPQSIAGTRIALRAFDGSAVAEDYDVLHSWWQRHRAARESRTALYYNTISLHDGNRPPDATGGWLAGYPARAHKLLDDISRFIDDLQASGARAIVVFIPEHGAAFHVAPGQIAGLRQVPGPKITQVPVGVLLVGLPQPAGPRPLRVDTSTSYLGLNELLAELLAAADADSGGIDFRSLLAHAQATPFVAENDGITVVRAADGYYTRAPDGHWSRSD